ncbi:hypothetical protein CXB51_031121 [Gossypium anomalum]|uniref:FLZ-type domain-containing protein n=1 Tax=Gossypium anomalum TaxID=47600 RepID=A0A8J5YVT3_9ROSI|nr:hypothetical protein CXB51_031121 [Gossypium anomalum]
MEAGDLRNHFQSNKQNGFFSRFLCYTRNSSKSKNVNPISCMLAFFARNLLRVTQTIFIYRRDTPFCSEVCRYKQIVIHELNGKLKLPVTVKALRNKNQMESKSNKAKSHGYPFHKSTTAAA